MTPVDLLLLSIIGDPLMRCAIERELDLRTLQRLARQLDERYFDNVDMPTGGRFARKREHEL